MMRLISLSLIFYKGKGTAIDKIIRFWTKSPLSHSEIETMDGYYCSNDQKTLVLRLKKIEPQKSEWESCKIVLPIEVARALRIYQSRKCGTKYDWEGILFSQFFKTGYCAKDRWFCSKSNLDDLQTAVKLMKNANRNGRYDKFIDAYEPFFAHKPQNISPARLHLLAKEAEIRLRNYNLLN
jgi:hypothetical protein